MGSTHISLALWFSLLPNWFKCTSSGPSAILKVLTCAHIFASGKSWQTPAAPWAWTALSITVNAIDGTEIFAMAICFIAPLASVLSIMSAALRTRKRAASISIRERATHSRITPWEESGAPKVERSGSLIRAMRYSRAFSAYYEVRKSIHVADSMFRFGRTYNTDRSHAMMDTAGPEATLNNFEPTARAEDDIASWNSAVSEYKLTVAVWGI